MDRRRDHEWRQVEGGNHFRAEGGALSVDGAGQQVDRIPDAPVEDEAVENRERGHRHASGEAAFQAGRHGVDLHRQACAMRVLANLEARHLPPFDARPPAAPAPVERPRAARAAALRGTSRSRTPASRRRRESTIATCVSSPANSSVTPRLSAIGYAVGAGSTTDDRGIPNRACRPCRGSPNASVRSVRLQPDRSSATDRASAHRPHRPMM